ncbi:bacillithiol system redox-active protein YtxJ [Pontibacillus marinus]|uniref:General stress protein n=1 Tax=Pontibacillus marinus BH030004 = DSM 16465 TaxID=1385511 RepID=A0A0A5FSF1_9BACI|nr:bacillithiol system redox-active protein YtxJ [Pontibacillus marinus]KGX83706.1 hypothetical protein N783_01630 [Pontibacillus marinus BH030004 = DSM 16465]
MNIQQLQSQKDFEQALETNEQFFLLKHSLTCPISSTAKQAYERFAETTRTPTYILHVQEARDLSQQIANSHDVKHESPQILQFKDHEVVWHTSHWNITPDSLERADDQS